MASIEFNAVINHELGDNIPVLVNLDEDGAVAVMLADNTESAVGHSIPEAFNKLAEMLRNQGRIH